MNGQRSAAFTGAACMVFTALLHFVGLGVNSANAQSDRAISHRGGEVTIVKRPSENSVDVRSGRFRCRSCVARAVERLKREPGISDVTIDESAELPILRVRFEPRRLTTTRIGAAVKKALESDPYNTAPVEVKYASDK